MIVVLGLLDSQTGEVRAMPLFTFVINQDGAEEEITRADSSREAAIELGRSFLPATYVSVFDGDEALGCWDADGWEAAE